MAFSHAEPSWLGRGQPILGFVLQRQTIALNRYGDRVSRIDGKAKLRSLLDENLNIPQRARMTYRCFHRIGCFVPLSEVNVFVTGTDLRREIGCDASFCARLLEDARITSQAVGEYYSPALRFREAAHRNVFNHSLTSSA
jgi:hypothetical protein